uniref:Gamma-aminobutyric acid type A receptor subunit pi n=1 Tax=Laticauda laticaudata TaxID=8630 RepID=A0A8C5RNS8_LATLA
MIPIECKKLNWVTTYAPSNSIILWTEKKERKKGKNIELHSSAWVPINSDYTATIYLRQRWTDPRLVFQGNRSFTLDARLVKYLWVPDTYIVESKRSFLHEVTVENRLIRLFSNGTVLYALRITTTVACNMDLSKYPLDTQTCKLQMESCKYFNSRGMWTFFLLSGLSLLIIRIYSVLFFLGSGIYPRLVLQFELKRNILYFILETYVPSSLLVILSWVSFWITLDSVPARTCIGVTTVLSMTTLMMGSRKSMTNANGFIKAIDIYLGICFSFIFGALVEYAVVHYITSQKHAANETQKVNLVQSDYVVNNHFQWMDESTKKYAACGIMRINFIQVRQGCQTQGPGAGSGLRGVRSGLWGCPGNCERLACGASARENGLLSYIFLQPSDSENRTWEGTRACFHWQSTQAITGTPNRNIELATSTSGHTHPSPRSNTTLNEALNKIEFDTPEVEITKVMFIFRIC